MFGMIMRAEPSTYYQAVNGTRTNKRRRSREEWLEEALRILALEGNRLLTIDRLCDRLGVSRGSFYWHFKGREDFLLAIIEHWEQQSTTTIRDKAFALKTGPEERLKILLEYIISYKYNKFELPIRLWAMKEPSARKVLQRIDRTRYEGVRSLFEEMGFTGDELEMRTQTCVIYHNFMDGLSIDLNKDKAATLRQARLRYRLLTQSCTGSKKAQ
jgi:AcrR family transcriptional regulator